jgi:CheY-specific phosphatase CheX
MLGYDMGDIIIDAVHDVFETFLYTLPEEQPAQETEETRLQGELIASIHIAGDMNGIISMTAQRKTARLLTRNMLGLEDGTPTDAEISDCAGEIVNVVAGNIKTRAIERGLNFTISIPTVVLGQGVVLSFPEEVLGIRIPFLVDEEEVVFSFFYKDAGSL